MLVKGFVYMLCFSREGEESLCADYFSCENSESTVAPEASQRPKGGDRGKELWVERLTV